MQKSANFRSRARVIDLLGRQQIADAPTAVGELFKNALDAGARNVWVDYWENQEALKIRDDGLGMRAEDVENKWLVLATESRHTARGVDAGWSRFADPEQAKWLSDLSYGEKGIGRLSVATLGRITLVWTVWGKGKDKQGTLCLVHWNLFQHPTKLFEDLPIPLRRVNRAPALTDIDGLFSDLRNSPQIKQILADKSWDKLLACQLESDLDPNQQHYPSDMKLSWEMGTTFFVFKTSDQVADLFAKARNDVAPTEDFSPDRLKSYHAFSTFWDPFHKHRKRVFKIHPTLSGKQLLKTHRYWDPSDFNDCDHHIRIEVDSSGFAKGTVKNYGKPPLLYSRQLKDLPKGHASPGSFLVEIGYVQGNKADSPLPDDIHTEIVKRLEHAGGFSIYLNKVRVQPYGGVDSDFAGFEERRLQNAGRYYFSTRRMFGGIFLPSKKGTTLEEKAGREGFVVNPARRGLRLWIEDLFTDLADTYFGRKSDRDDKKEKKRQKEAAAAKARLEKEKEDYIASIRAYKGWLRDFDQRVKAQVQKARGLLASEANSFPGTFLHECEGQLDILHRLAAELRATPSDAPVGVVLEGDALVSADEYLTHRGTAISHLNREIANQTKEFQKLQGRARSLEDQERHIVSRIAAVDSQIRMGVEELLRPALEKAEHLATDLRAYAQRELTTLGAIRDDALNGKSVREISRDLTGELARELEAALQAQLDALDSNTAPRLKRLVNDIEHLTDDSSGVLVLAEQTSELTLLKERQAFLVEMAQLGLILEAANHEHEKQVECIRSSIRLLEKNVSSSSRRDLEALSDSFEIIDARMRLFDPLIRRRSSSVAQLSGDEIEAFLRQRFPDAFSAPDFIEITPSFRGSIIPNVKRPVFLGAVHNIFHNALYWAAKSKTVPRIRFSASGLLLTVSDSGPGISPRDMKRIFEPGFSRRPYGRGLGLFIAREALRGIGFELYSPDQPELGALEGANFTIVSKSER